MNLTYLDMLYGNTFFAFICQHSLSGIVAPLVPQSEFRSSVLKGHVFAVGILAAQGMLAFWAFGGLHSDDCNEFPCQVQVSVSDAN